MKTWKELQSPLYCDPDRGLALLDQRLLPTKEQWDFYRDEVEIAKAIKDMVVRGAPAIGCAAAYGIALGARSFPNQATAMRAAFDRAKSLLGASRPTAVNLFWALDEMEKVFVNIHQKGKTELCAALMDKADRIWKDDLDSCRRMGKYGAALIPKGARILTHCNAGALATAGYGTALGVIRAAHENDPSISVYADETRPYLQGARLTAWELQQSGIDVTLICDNMAGALMAAGEIDLCIVGADRIAANGDFANKIGTYMVAAIAARHQIPFYVAAPLSTIDLLTADGGGIVIEERDAKEVTHFGDKQLAPDGIKVRNLAFDITPAELCEAIITEAGIAKAPYLESLKDFF